MPRSLATAANSQSSAMQAVRETRSRTSRKSGANSRMLSSACNHKGTILDIHYALFSAMNTVRFSGLWLTESFLDNRPSLSLRSTGYFRNDEHASHRARSRSHRRGHFHFHELALDGRYLSSVPKRNAQHLATGRSAQLCRGE